MKREQNTKQQSLYIFILTLDGGGYYLGHAENLDEQLDIHNSGGCAETSGRNPQLVWSELWTDNAQNLRKRIDKLNSLYKEDPKSLVFNLQARLRLGGYLTATRWG